MSTTHLQTYTERNRAELNHQVLDSEFVALRIATDMVKTLRYKLSTFGVNLKGPSLVYWMVE